MLLGKRKSIFFKGAIIEAVGNPVSLIIGLIVIPFYFDFLNSSEFGIWLTLFEIISFFGLFYAGTDILIIQVISKNFKSDLSNVRTQISNIFFLQLLIFIFITFFQLLTYFHLSFFGINIQENNLNTLFFCIVFWFFLNNINHILISIIAGKNNIALSSTCHLFTKISQQLFPLIFLYTGFTLNSFPFSYITSSILIYLFLSFLVYKDLIRLISFNEISLTNLKKPFEFLIKMFLGRTGWYLINATDAIIISKFLSTSEVTTFVLTMKLCNVFKFLSSKIINLGFPSYVQLISNKEYDKITNVFYVIYFQSLRVGILLSFIIVIFNQIFVSNWVGIDKFGGLAISIISALICFRESLIPIFTNIIHTTEDVKSFNIIVFIESIMNVFFSIILISKYGIVGVAFATLITTCFISSFYSFFKIKSILNIDFSKLSKITSIVVLKSLPSILIQIWGYSYIIYNFSWMKLFIVIFASILVNIVFFEGFKFYKFRKLKFRKLIEKIFFE